MQILHACYKTLDFKIFNIEYIFHLAIYYCTSLFYKLYINLNKCIFKSTVILYTTYITFLTFAYFEKLCQCFKIDINHFEFISQTDDVN